MSSFGICWLTEEFEATVHYYQRKFHPISLWLASIDSNRSWHWDIHYERYSIEGACRLPHKIMGKQGDGLCSWVRHPPLNRVERSIVNSSPKVKLTNTLYRTSFDQHVIGGYKFLMRFYSPGDDIYMFGFSRGAYTARFLAEMLDHVGLVATGNEEMVLFAWKTFSAWQQRRDNSKGGALYE